MLNHYKQDGHPTNGVTMVNEVFFLDILDGVSLEALEINFR